MLRYSQLDREGDYHPFFVLVSLFLSNVNESVSNSESKKYVEG